MYKNNKDRYYLKYGVCKMYGRMRTMEIEDCEDRRLEL